MLFEIHAGPWLNRFDLAGSTFFSHIANRSWALDHAVIELDNNYLLRGGIIMVLVWMAIFRGDMPGQLRKGFELALGATFLGTFGTVIARVMAHFLPYRVRPFTLSFLHFPDTGWHLPLWGCFPSDHGVLFTAIAVGIFFVSRSLGLLALSGGAIAICLPRLYLGEHWPTDMLVGIAMGVGSAFLVKIPAVRKFFERSIARLHVDYPRAFLTELFVWSLSLATVFEDPRHVLGLVINMFKVHS
jgi:undecaprenyl-diphosphatase